jgi:hypothetical protein
VYIKTCKKIADIMTKQSAGPQFAQHRDGTLGGIDVIAAVIAAVAEIGRKIRILILVSRSVMEMLSRQH